MRGLRATSPRSSMFRRGMSRVFNENNRAENPPRLLAFKFYLNVLFVCFCREGNGTTFALEFRSEMHNNLCSSHVIKAKKLVPELKTQRRSR